MAQAHLDRLTAVDASFLAQEGEHAHMHIGLVLVFSGAPPSYADFCDQIRSRLHLVPRYRQRLAVPRFQSGRPLWVDDPTFNLEFHLRHAALPAPGSEEQLRNLVARIHSQRLDRSKPLWEMWLVQGLTPDAGTAAEGGGRCEERFALLGKTHHSMIDGIAGVDLTTVLLDVEPNPAPAAHPGRAWTPAREPTDAELISRTVGDAVRAPLRLAGRAAAAFSKPSDAIESAREAAEGLGELVWAGLNPAPETPLNVPIGPHRRMAFVRSQLDDFKLIKDTFGGTVNDVVLAVVTGALRRFLLSRGERCEGLELRALVPVSVRTQDDRGQLGNRLVAMRGPLPVYIDDPVTRLRVVKQSMDGLKESKQAVGAELLTAVQSFAPPTVLAQASRLNFSSHLFNLLVTNIPGPQFPVYLLGRRMVDLFPVAFLPKEHALSIAIMSYDGGLDMGLLGDYDTLPDIEAVGEFLEASRDELLGAARRRARRSRRTPKAARRVAA